MQRLSWVLLSLIAGCCLAPAATPRRFVDPRFRSDRPNIIFILADDLGYGDLGCYGQKRIKTPNLDRLAAEGMRFTSVYAGTTVCAPSRCALLTGRHTGHTVIRGNDDRSLRPEDVTLAEVLQPAGYRSAVVGKWGLGNDGQPGVPHLQGFQDFVGFLDQTDAHNYYPSQLWRYPSEHNELFAFQVPGNLDGRKGTYVPDVFSMIATNFVRDNRWRPFFLYLAYTTPHAHNELKDRGMEVPSAGDYAAEPWPEMERNKAAMISRLDRDVGAVLEMVRRYQLETNTIIFFTSDNGPHREGGVNPAFFQSAGGLRGIKRDLYEGGIRVPMIVRWTGHIAPGRVSDEPWAFWDVMPTLAALAGTKPPADIDGQSVLPLLLGQPWKPQEFLYWEFHEQGSQQAVRTGDWKAVRRGVGQPLELFNLKTDPGETNNVAAANPAVIQRVEDYLKTARTPDENYPLLTPAEWRQRRQQKKEAAAPPAGAKVTPAAAAGAGLFVALLGLVLWRVATPGSRPPAGDGPAT